jgi:hypothetical protein
MNDAWSRTLDAIEIHLVATQGALDAGTPPPRPQHPVFPAEPLPPELAARARSLVELTQRLETVADGRLERLQAALRVLPGRRGPARRPHTGSFVDVGA